MSAITEPTEKERKELLQRHQQLKSVIGNASLLAVSKGQPLWKIQTLFQSAGQLAFGENRVSELQDKMASLSKDIQWTYLGAIQKNHWRILKKIPVRLAAVDTDKLLQWNQTQPSAVRHSILIQVALETGAGRSGASLAKAEELILKYSESNAFVVEGIMFMPLADRQPEERKAQFSEVHAFFNQWNLRHTALPLKTLSQGMSDDYALAIQCGSTEVRIGTELFGKRIL